MSANILQARTAAEIFLASTFDESKARLPGNACVAKWREDAFQVFTASGLPHRRIEAWHYTDLRALMRDALPVATAPGAAVLSALREEFAATGETAAPRLVLVDGFFAPELSSGLPEGIKVSSLACVLTEGRPDLIALLSSQDLAKDLGARESIVALNARRARSSHSCHGFARARRAFLPFGLDYWRGRLDSSRRILPCRTSRGNSPYSPSQRLSDRLHRRRSESRSYRHGDRNRAWQYAPRNHDGAAWRRCKIR